jgi:sugar-specific transcriptional regulator TrmB
MIIDQLILQGLSRKEAEVYVVLVRYGSNRAADICRRVKINRTLVYALLESLVRKGFVEKLARNGRVLYTANDPSVFVQSAKSQLERAHYLAEDLHSVQLVKSQPVIRTFQGLDGIKQMTDIFLEEAQQAGGDMLQMGQEIQFVLDHPELIESFIGKRLERKIPLKLLCNKFEGFKKYLNERRDPLEMREVKLVDTESFNVDCTTYLYGDSMAVLSLADEMQGYIMKSKNITDMHRQMFFLLWNRL